MFNNYPPVPTAKPLGALSAGSGMEVPAVNGFAPQAAENGFMDRMMSPQALMGLSMMANSGPSLAPRGMFDGIPQALAMANQHQRQKQEYDMRAGMLKKAEAEKAEKKSALNRTAQYYAKLYGDDEQMVTDIFNAGQGQSYLTAKKDATPDMSETFDMEEKLRKEIAPKRKMYDAAEQGYSKVLAAAKDGTGASDIALIFGYMKTLDPTSTVREGEFATAQEVGGAGAKVMSLYNRVVGGERLTPEQRQEIANAASQQFNVSRMQFEQEQNYMRGLVPQYGSNLSPDRVLRPLGQFEQPEPPASAPAVTTGTASTGKGFKVIGVR